MLAGLPLLATTDMALDAPQPHRATSTKGHAPKLREVVRTYSYVMNRVVLAIQWHTLHDISRNVKKTGDASFDTGGTSDLWMGELTRTDSSGTLKSYPVAIKVIRCVGNSTSINSIRAQKDVIREGRIWNRLERSFITPFYGVFRDYDRSFRIPSLVSPYYERGTVKEHLKRNPEANRLKWITQIASALAYIHKLNPHVVHGDIKAANILVNDNMEASISDFGLSSSGMIGSPQSATTLKGTYRWMAVELFDIEETPPLTTKSDVWAFSMTVVEILTGNHPFATIKTDMAFVAAMVRNPDLRPTRHSCAAIPDAIWAILLRCWHKDPNCRPSMNCLALVFDLVLVGSPSVSEVEQLLDGEELREQMVKFTTPGGREAGDYDWNKRPIISLDSDLSERHLHPCRWTSCKEGFTDFEACQLHEWEHFVQWNGKKSLALGPLRASSAGT